MSDNVQNGERVRDAVVAQEGAKFVHMDFSAVEDKLLPGGGNLGVDMTNCFPGKWCETCGSDQVTCCVRDYWEDILEDGAVHTSPDDALHYYCSRHARKAKCLGVSNPQLRGLLP